MPNLQLYYMLYVERRCSPSVLENSSGISILDLRTSFRFTSNRINEDLKIIDLPETSRSSICPSLISSQERGPDKIN